MCFSLGLVSDSLNTIIEVQPWHTPGHLAPGPEGAQVLSVDWSSLKGIIHGLVTTDQEGQWAFIVLLPITSSQAYL